MKKILHISHTDILKDARICKELNTLSGLSLNNIKLFAIGIKSKEGPTHIKDDKKYSICNLNIITFNFHNKLFFIGAFISFVEIFFKFLFSCLKIKPNVVHCHDCICLPIALSCKLLFNSKIIYDAHELNSNKNNITKFNSLVFYFLERISWKFIDLFFTVGEEINDWYKKNFGPKLSYVIYNSPIVNEIKLPKKNLKQKFNIKPNEKLFVYLGIFGKGRGIKKILKCFSNKNVKSHVIFIGWGEFESLIKREAINNSNIHYHKPFKYNSIIPNIKVADFGLCLIENVSLSDYYSLPNKLFEYIFSKTFVLSFSEIIIFEIFFSILSSFIYRSSFS